MSGVFIDTAPLIYLIEGEAQRRAAVQRQIIDWITMRVPIWSSVLSLTELLVPLKKSGDSGRVFQYKAALSDLLSGPLHRIGEEECEKAAEIRARYGLATPDALQLAVALSLGCDRFFTNDHRLKKVKDIAVVLVDMPES